jgi:hypothetical protein
MAPDTIQPRSEADPRARFPLGFEKVIGAIYRIAFSRPGDHDVFRNAAVGWTDFLAPLALHLVLNTTYAITSDTPLREAVATGARPVGIFLGLIAAGILLRAVVGFAVTWALAYGLAAHERVGPGLLAYLWMQAILISPWVIVLRGVSGHDPLWMIVLFGFVPALYLLYCASRVMRTAFALPNLGFGLLFAMTGNVVSYVVDSLIPW